VSFTMAISSPSQAAVPLIFKPHKGVSRAKQTLPLLESLDREEAIEGFGRQIMENMLSETEKASILIDELIRSREPLIRTRSALVQTPFFLFRKRLRREVADLDKEIDEIDLELLKHRRSYNSLSRELIEEMRETNQAVSECVRRIEEKLGGNS